MEDSKQDKEKQAKDKKEAFKKMKEKSKLKY
jgi:hypothetical protein